MSEEQKDRFWDALPIPYQTEDGEYDFANPIVVQQHFLRLSKATAIISEKAEQLTKTLSELEDERAEEQYKLGQLRRRLFAANYKLITKSASNEIQDAFILMTARGTDQEDDLLALEERIHELDGEIRRLKPRIERLWTRQKQIQLTIDAGKQYLDYEKKLMHIENNGGRM